MRVNVDGATRELRTVWLEDGLVKLIDQRHLPFRLEVFEAKHYEDVARAIEDMVVRGSPAIGATAAYALAQAHTQGVPLAKVAERLQRTRPTGRDLFVAIESILQAAKAGADPVEAAERYAREDVERCLRIGEHGEKLLKSGTRILTHCNAGALATVDVGTAMAPIRAAHAKGRRLFVYVDETRPRLQGARLTAWELAQEGIEHAIIADSAAGYFMKRGEVDLVLVGADRIAANGDTANKIGTYATAVLAKENGIPFYAAAPSSTIDLALPTGDKIPIEERSPQEVLHLNGEPIAPHESPARNPAFDVTPAKYITGIITERGILKPGRLKSALAEVPKARAARGRAQKKAR